MADKCANCGEAITLEPDSNGGERWYHEGDTIHCKDSEIAAKPAVKVVEKQKGDE